MKDVQYCAHQVYEIFYHARFVTLLFISCFSSHSHTMEEYKKGLTYIHKEKKKTVLHSQLCQWSRSVYLYYGPSGNLSR